ncbi:phage major capsid protein [Dietzia cinnamea]|uniref:phage major capsid protein n=1 Tax=Dietzia cinnamea TaxID=321318 RepID=UPI0021A70D15|nr:phage major capsid protein [Dietzia cinnamea]MCT1639740.1 phage major capsid protein [Dietzia cinnamea]
MALNTYDGDLTTFLVDLAAPLVERILKRSVAAQMSTSLRTLDNGITIPIVDSDATATWTAEGAEIVQSVPNLRSLKVKTGKLAGIVPITGEAIRSRRLDLLQIASRSLVRDMSGKLDAAFFGDVADPAPDGIGSLGTDVVTIQAESGDNLDALIDAVTILLDSGYDATDVAMAPGTLGRLAKVKKGTGSNESLLGPDATLGGVLDADQLDGTNAGRAVLGLAPRVSRHVPEGQFVVVDRGQTYTALTGEPVLDTSEHAEFTKDTVLIRALQSAGFGFPHADALVRVALPPVA